MAESAWGGKWLWYNLESDLNRYGLEDFKVIKIERDHIIGRAMGEFIRIDWKANNYCIITMHRYLPSIGQVFTEVLEIPPLAVYFKEGYVITEFEKANPKKRLQELKGEYSGGLIQQLKIFGGG